MTVKYLKIYKKDEPVTKNTYLKGRLVVVEISNKFLEKIEIDEKIEKLPLKLKQVIILCLIEHIKPEKVAHILGVHTSTVYRRLDRALKMLRNIT